MTLTKAFLCVLLGLAGAYIYSIRGSYMPKAVDAPPASTSAADLCAAAATYDAANPQVANQMRLAAGCPATKARSGP